jgi:hypothetical protein
MRARPSQSNEYKEALEYLREELDTRALIHRSDVSGLLKTAYDCWSPDIYESVVTRLRVILENYNTNARRQPDPFRPYGPESLLNQGDLHLMDQMDNVPCLIDHNKLLTGVLILGPQRSGKSRLIRHLINELLRIV